MIFVIVAANFWVNKYTFLFIITSPDIKGFSQSTFFAHCWVLVSAFLIEWVPIFEVLSTLFLDFVLSLPFSSFGFLISFNFFLCSLVLYLCPFVYLFFSFGSTFGSLILCSFFPCLSSGATLFMSSLTQSCNSSISSMSSSSLISSLLWDSFCVFLLF